MCRTVDQIGLHQRHQRFAKVSRFKIRDKPGLFFVCLFSSFSQDSDKYSTQFDYGVFGITTRDPRMVGEDEFTELGGPPRSFLSCHCCAEWSPRTSEYWGSKPSHGHIKITYFLPTVWKDETNECIDWLIGVLFLGKIEWRIKGKLIYLTKTQSSLCLMVNRLVPEFTLTNAWFQANKFKVNTFILKEILYSRIHESQCLIANKFGLDVSASAALLHWHHVAKKSLEQAQPMSSLAEGDEASNLAKGWTFPPKIPAHKWHLSIPTCSWPPGHGGL